MKQCDDDSVAQKSFAGHRGVYKGLIRIHLAWVVPKQTEEFRREVGEPDKRLRSIAEERGLLEPRGSARR